MPCIIACDDGFVHKVGNAKKGFTLVGCILYKDMFPLDIDFSHIRIDGLDSSSIISGLAIKLIEGKKGCSLVKPTILLDTIIFAGFNIASVNLIKQQTGMDVIAFYPYKPNADLLVDTVFKHLDFPHLRVRLIKSQLAKLTKITTNKGTSYVVSTVEDKYFLNSIVEFYQVYTNLLEPLRTAHMTTSSLSRLFR
ncbi:MAG: DUF99 family protein [Desulfurococcales archaeon]|nr:DUF99 family protein [Desulfurococcales archaeon]